MDCISFHDTPKEIVSKLIMDFHVFIRQEDRSHLECATGQATIIPFDATVASELFTGKTLPGAVDVQFTNAAGIRHMCAKYMFEGVDYTGTACRLFVCNDGFFEPDSRPKPFHTCPHFMTDSHALAGYLHREIFRAEGSREEDCLHIRIYDVS